MSKSLDSNPYASICTDFQMNPPLDTYVLNEWLINIISEYWIKSSKKVLKKKVNKSSLRSKLTKKDPKEVFLGFVG
jgi:hypothetical protein